MQKLNNENLMELNGGAAVLAFATDKNLYYIGFDHGGIVWGREPIK